jgi:hypothetical protein
MTTEPEKLANNLLQGISDFHKKCDEASAYFDACLKEGHDTVNHAMEHGRTLSEGIGKLKAAMERLTNV